MSESEAQLAENAKQGEAEGAVEQTSGRSRRRRRASANELSVNMDELRVSMSLALSV